MQKVCKQMNEVAQESYFAPSRRTEGEALAQQIRLVSESPLLNTILSIMAGILVILNEDRQVIGLNHVFLNMLGINDPEKALGLRFGESVGCLHAKVMPGGCGTSKHCASCGAVIAMMTSLTTNESAERLCALEMELNGVAKDMALMVRTSPIVLMGQRLLVVAVQDVTQEQFRANLERVFYHDINNMLTSLLIPAEMLAREMPERWDVARINEAAKRLHQEVSLQRELSLAGNGGFSPQKQQVALTEINSDVELLIRLHRAADDKFIEVTQECPDCLIYTDKMLVGRVLANMLINALEATPSGGSIQLRTRQEGGRVIWDVCNSAYIAEDLQLRIFQRHFTTKPGVGRGLGTFSMKLFGEKYLLGTVGFTSDRMHGTIFSLSLPVHV
jgi:signal transduction histidine kinase